jgi:flagellin FlaB
MFEFINNEDERGQVGIGTLIVFIAMVLVAAIAAGVLINTAGVLQTQAEETGQDSTDQVANNINVIGTVGDVNSAPDGIETVRVTVQKSAGAGDVDLSGLSIQYVGPDSFANLIHANEVPDTDPGTTADPDTATYGVEAITANTPGDTVMTSEGDRYQIVVPLTDQAVTLTEPDESYDIDNSDAGLEKLEESEQVELTITTPSGSQRYVTLQVPDSLVGQGDSTVQL